MKGGRDQNFTMMTPQLLSQGYPRRHLPMENYGKSKLCIIGERERERERERDRNIVIVSVQYPQCSYIVYDRFGDRILSVNSQDFTSIARREATEMLRSCDQLSITLEIGRITSHVKPLPQVNHSLSITACIHVHVPIAA